MDLFAAPPVPKLPKGTTPLALLDVESGKNVTTNSFGEIIGLDPIQVLILPLLKGDWDREEAIAQLTSMYAKGQFSANPAPTTDEQRKQLFSGIIDGHAAGLKAFGVVG
jgi:hypothetical protein